MKQQYGRSILETVGAIVLISVLTTVGFYGFSILHKNTIVVKTINDINVAMISAAEQLNSGGGGIL